MLLVSCYMLLWQVMLTVSSQGSPGKFIHYKKIRLKDNQEVAFVDTGKPSCIRFWKFINPPN